MPSSTYDKARPTLTAELSRAVKVESGHACAISGCGEHTYLEIHHINENREDNRIENLVLLCDKHHKMAHAGVIDRKALTQYKKNLKTDHSFKLAQRLARLEELVAAQPTAAELAPSAQAAPPAALDPGLPTLSFSSRAEISARTLEELALSRFERQRGVYLRRHATFDQSELHLRLDGLYQSPDGSKDMLVEVRWIRKRYLDAAIWVQQVAAATEAYELFTGREATSILICVTPNKDWGHPDKLPMIAAELCRHSRAPELVVYNYRELGFEPAPLSSLWLKCRRGIANPVSVG